MGQASGSPAPTSRPDVASIDRDRILAAANRFLTVVPKTLTASPAPHSQATAHDYFSLNLDAPPAVLPKSGPAPSPTATFTAHADALLEFTLVVPALAAGWWLTRTTDAELARRFAGRAATHLRAWFLDPETRMNPSLEFAAAAGEDTPGRPQGVAEGAALAEVAQAISFLARSEALSADEVSGLRGWFAAFLKWLTAARLAGLAKDAKDHVGSSWLLLAAASARLAGDDAALAELRHQFKTVTMRAEILADGTFPHELTTPDGYRNSLFNLDLLAAATDLLSTRFETLWEFQLQDGPGMRVAIARHAPYIENRGIWPYKADSRFFSELPCRRPSLLFAARAYQRPEYATLWRSLNPDPTNPVILRTFPIRQPLLWVTRAQP
jgi:hypothetical protein